MNETAKQHWPDVAALIILTVLTLVFFWKIALTNRVLAGLDVFAYFYPYRDFASEALRSGRLPLWNPYLFMGAPLLANSQTAVLYPLHWPLIWLSAPKQIAWSIVLHIWLAGVGTNLFARWVLGLRPLASLAVAVIFALGGFLGAQVEHVNQLNASAWLPWLLLCLERAVRQSRWRWLALLSGGAIVGLMLLAGHTQAAYIVLFGMGIYALLRGWPALKQREWLLGVKGIGALAAMSLMGLLLAAGQLLPTLELSRLSVRSGGLPYNEAASFSLKPTLLFKAFLPPLIWEPPFSEYVAYVGLIGLALAAVGAWAVFRRKQSGGAILGLALVSVFLAFGAYNPVYYLLYKVVPGFALFRAPARWLLLYSFGVAVLAGIGLDVLFRRESPPPPTPPPREGSLLPLLRGERVGVRGRLFPALVIALLLVIELFVARRKLAYNNPTAPMAFDSMRTAPTHLLADAAHGSLGEPFRFLSMSDIRYDPGDLADLHAMYSDPLPKEAIYDLVVTTKMKEVLAYNLPLRYRLFSVDGYDGGLLPIEDYVTLERLFLTEDEIWPDGRLRQQLREIPPARLLSLLNVKYIITDKTQDVWIDDVFYDLEHTIPLGAVTLARDSIPDFEATHLGIVSYLTGTKEVTDGTPVAQVLITDTQGATVTETLYAGKHAAEGLYADGSVAHRQARVGHYWRDNEKGNDYVATLSLGGTIQPERIAVRTLLPDGRFQLRGLTLIDENSGTNRTLSIHPAYRQVHSGDVKIYQNLDVLPRAFVVHRASLMSDEEEALAALGDPAFNPGHEIILAEGERLAGPEGKSDVKIVAYESEEVRLGASLDAPGYLVLTDTYYPGWEAEVNGRPAPIQRANLYFRAVWLEAGTYEVVFKYRPVAVRWGLLLSVAAWLVWGLAIAVMASRIGRKFSSSV